MRLKTRIKWWYYNSFMSVFLMSHFNLFLTFTLSELYEIELARNSIHHWLKKLCGVINVLTNLKRFHRRVNSNPSI